ncbi:hypothetical protein C8F04DRAFT_395656 [Mycena alexandri]|uniref:Uncharacterized protein n=1 Tax=Mycena alexandri TaxID=1745969 RepID=A0AAD6T5L0_9AGAR|nr:hypothetical protein C8F04DRAFT_395656 [Mycena alexandri]
MSESESIWIPPPGLLSTPHIRPPGERPESLPQPGCDPEKHWYHYGCMACEEIRGMKEVIAGCCTPEELLVEPWKSMGDKSRLFLHNLECEMWYYKAYSKTLEARLHRVRTERTFVTGRLQKAQAALSTLRQEVSALGTQILEDARVGGWGMDVDEQNPNRSVFSTLKKQLICLGVSLGGLVHRAAEESPMVDEEICNSSSTFSILA